MKLNILMLLTAMVPSLALAQGQEFLMGMTTSAEGITFQVTSGGCTAKESFNLEIGESSPVRLTLVRNGFDICEAYLPYGTTVTYSWKELKFKDGTAFTVTNQFYPALQAITE